MSGEVSPGGSCLRQRRRVGHPGTRELPKLRQAHFVTEEVDSDLPKLRQEHTL